MASIQHSRKSASGPPSLLVNFSFDEQLSASSATRIRKLQMNVHRVYNGEKRFDDSDPEFFFSWGRIKDFEIQGNKYVSCSLCQMQWGGGWRWIEGSMASVEM